jgi:hypothetical protein
MPFKEATFWYGTILFTTGIYFWIEGGDRVTAGIILTVIGFIMSAYAVIAEHYPSLPKLRVWVALLLITWAALGYDYYDHYAHALPSTHRVQMSEWGGGLGIVWAVFNSTPLLSDADKYRVMMACLIEDHTVDVMKNARLEKSAMFEIRGDSMRIEIPVRQDFRTRIDSGGSIELYLIEIPKSVRVEDITTPASIELLGGKLVDAQGVGFAPGHFDH